MSEVPVYEHPWLGMDDKSMKTLKNYVDSLSIHIPKDSINRPIKLINVDALINTGLRVDVKHLLDYPSKDLYHDLTFEEGFPSINGIAIWNHIEGEPLTCYRLFKEYRDMRTSDKVRSIYSLSKQTNTDPSVLEKLRSIFNWTYRVRAYEDFRQYERDQLLEMRRLEVQGRHSLAAEKLFNMSVELLEKNKNLMTAKDVIKMLEVSYKLERLTVGMAGEKNESTYNPGSSLQLNINNIQQSGNSGATIVGGKDIDTGSSGDLDSDRQNVAEIINVMEQMGLLAEDENIIDVECTEVEE